MSTIGIRLFFIPYRSNKGRNVSKPTTISSRPNGC